MMKTFTTIISIAILFSLVGCSLVKPRDGSTMSQAEKVALLRSLVRSTTALSIVEGNDDREKQRDMAGKLREHTNKMVEILETKSGDELGISLVSEINKLDFTYKHIVVVALNLFNTHFSTPELSDVMTMEELVYIEALIRGLNDGAIDVLQMTE